MADSSEGAIVNGHAEDGNIAASVPVVKGTHDNANQADNQGTVDGEITQTAVKGVVEPDDNQEAIANSILDNGPPSEFEVASDPVANGTHEDETEESAKSPSRPQTPSSHRCSTTDPSSQTETNGNNDSVPPSSPEDLETAKDAENDDQNANANAEITSENQDVNAENADDGKVQTSDNVNDQETSRRSSKVSHKSESAPVEEDTDGRKSSSDGEEQQEDQAQTAEPTSTKTTKEVVSTETIEEPVRSDSTGQGPTDTKPDAELSDTAAEAIVTIATEKPEPVEREEAVVSDSAEAASQIEAAKKQRDGEPIAGASIVTGKDEAELSGDVEGAPGDAPEKGTSFLALEESSVAARLSANSESRSEGKTSQSYEKPDLDQLPANLNPDGTEALQVPVNEVIVNSPVIVAEGTSEGEQESQGQVTFQEKDERGDTPGGSPEHKDNEPREQPTSPAFENSLRRETKSSRRWWQVGKKDSSGEEQPMDTACCTIL